MLVEIRHRKAKGDQADQVWTYGAPSVEIAARRHVDELYGARARKPPDFWTLHSLKPVGPASKIDGRQEFEAKFRTERSQGLADWETVLFIVRPLTPPDPPDILIE